MIESNSRPSVQDVARVAGVSLGTVSNALNSPERVTAKTLEKVAAAIEQLGFVRNEAARQLKAGRSKTIGLVVPDISNPFFSELARGAEDAAEQSAITVVLGNSGVNLPREASYLQLFEEQRMSGILISPIDDVADSVRRSQSRGTSIVVVDRQADTNLACSVAVDDVVGGQMAVDHLISVGATKVAFVGGPLDYHQVRDRLLGAESAIAATNGLAKLEVIFTSELTVLAGRNVGEQILLRPQDQRPDAIFAANDLLAIGILQSFAFGSRVKVPGDIALIGYDDIDFAASAIVPLTSVRQPAHQLGAKAVELLLQEVSEGQGHKHQQVTFQPELVVRSSTIG